MKYRHNFQTWISHENTNRIIKKTEYSINIYVALNVRLFPNKRLNVDLKNIEIRVSHGLKVMLNTDTIFKHEYLMNIPIESSKKNLNIVFTCTECLTFIFFQINV